ncbi:SusD/RagB family nutrient-binding outer membrane lipoprotein [Pedobacter chinensis]|uniref:SusD/RagB family nutrient-binding outer membrane lipoprotein n=1 Tax=Pedobacter chinensis TaxID=2282421 RepID=A0A369PWP4_9SPHI|nr:SusD/RagB family nutrient-binding outer membrane lipoprotein [Pedobacter chinensis]RDC56682.1 SusD/RagB family nutrient-binding outer membrane lipoprotein [Pedobacter chinensis]
MKNIKKYILLAVSVGVLATSCKKFGDFGDTNVDRTKVSKAATRALLTYAMQKTQARGDQSGSSAANTAGVAVLSSTGAIFGQHISEGPYLTVSPFNDAGSTLNPSYYTFYSEILKNLNQIITFAEAGAPEADAAANGSINNQIAVARIMKAYVFWKVTDRWGDIPYTEALNIENITPRFSKQEDIYKDLFKELKEAVAQIDGGAGPTGDIMFNGDMTSWKKFAATQRLLMALRLSKVYPNAGDFAATEFASALAATPITAGETLEYTFLGGDPNNYNPWYNNYSISKRNDFAISKTLVDIMKNNASGTDPRLPVYGEVLAGNQVIGLQFGVQVQTNIPNSYSRIGEALRTTDAPAYIFTGAQVQFALAEAAKRGWIAGGDAIAATYYNAGIDASLTQYGVADPAFKTLTGIVYNPATALQQIGTQRWIALYLDGWEAWTEFRRTGFPALVPGPNSQNGTVIPRRVGYPTADQTTNRDNYDAALAQQGWTNNSINNRMWWDKP